MSPYKPPRETTVETNRTNPSQLGDLDSVKSKTSTNPLKSQNRGASPSHRSNDINNYAPAPTEGDTDGKGGTDGHKTLRQRAMEKLDENPSQLGDPVSLKAENAESEPTENDRGVAGKSGRSGKPKSKL